MEILKGTKCSGKYIKLIQDVYQGCKTYLNSNAQYGQRKQQLWCGGRTSSRLAHKPIAVPTPDGCVDKGCEKEHTWSNDVRI